MTRAFESYAGDVISTLEPPRISVRTPPYPRPFIDGLHNAITIDISEWNEARGGSIYEDGLGVSGYNPLTSEEISGVDGLIIDHGFEALAFYKSIRFKDMHPFRGQWGVFIFQYGIDYLANEAALTYPTEPTSLHKTLALLALLHHELFHFRVDVWSLGIEAVTRKSHYEEYLFNVRANDPLAVLAFEEALANKATLSILRRAKGYLWIKDFYNAQPGFYAKYDQPWQYLSACLAAQILSGLAFPDEDKGIAHSPFIGSGDDKVVGPMGCPRYIIPKIRPHAIFPLFRALPEVEEVRDGFIKRYLNGNPDSFTDHAYYRIDNGQKVRVPNDHRERLTRNEYSNILYHAGMNSSGYWKAREETKTWKKQCPRSEILGPLK